MSEYHILNSLERLHSKVDHLTRRIKRMSRAALEEDEKMSEQTDAILKQLSDAKTANDGFRVILQHLVDNQDNPAELQKIASAISDDQTAWTTAFNTVPPDGSSQATS